METQTRSQEKAATPSVVRLPSPRAGLLGFEIRMPVMAKDFREVARILSEAYEEHENIDLLVRIVGGVRFRFELLREHLWAVKRDALDHVARYAVVGGPGWLETAVKLLNPLFRMEVRHFDVDDEDDAWDWLEKAAEDA